jgi:hypothetical protein
MIMSQSSQAYWYANVCIVGFYYQWGAATVPGKTD